MSAVNVLKVKISEANIRAHIIIRGTNKEVNMSEEETIEVKMSEVKM